MRKIHGLKKPISAERQICPVAFSIGSKGYIGTGDDGEHGDVSDFWEYDPATNTWTQKADFGGGALGICRQFCHWEQGYVGTGCRFLVTLKDFWEYDPTTNIWTRKADFGGVSRFQAVGFSIGPKGT